MISAARSHHPTDRHRAWRRQALFPLCLCLLMTVCARPADYGRMDRELNRRQPPDKVLAAAGVRPCLVVGEAGAAGAAPSRSPGGLR
jgi:hypothetical protein